MVPHPFVGDDLIGSFLTVVDGRQSGVGLALEAGRGAPGVRGKVVQVQVLLVGQVLLLQRLKQHVGVVPDLHTKHNHTYLLRPKWTERVRK